MKYDPKSIEPKWQKFWEDNQTFRVETDASKEKFFGLIEFPYPSGAGLHVGHPRSYTAMDVITRQKRMEGKNVLYPIGFDSFGLPTENFAIKTGRPPAEITDENIANFTRQLKALGFGFDWSRAVTTSEPEYYKWTQWIFLQLYKHGLAYKANQPINWCPKDKIGLANEEVVDGCCERCGNPVEKRNKEQWMLAITKYADKLLEGLNEVDYITRAKIQQENWIGRSEGAEINFAIKNSEQKIKVFTTRPDTIFGVTFLAVSAEWAQKWFADKTVSNEINKYIAEILQSRTTAVAREEVEKTGIDSGIVAVNPVSGEEVPVWIVNYVLADVGTGAIMAVPAHDERDWEFAKKFNLIIKPVVMYSGHSGEELSEQDLLNYIQENGAETEEGGIMINSDFLNDLETIEAKAKMIAWLEEKGIGNRKVQFKLRDWVFSRQRYWGEPIPLVFCENCADKKYNVVIIHGFSSVSNHGFKPWLKEELEKQGHTVWSPDLPNTTTPNIDEQAEFIIHNAPFKIDGHTILVGSSLGGVVMYKLLEKLIAPIAKAVFVDPVVKPEYNDREPREAVLDSCDWKFNWEKIREHANERIVLADVNYPIIKKEHLEELNKNIDGRLVVRLPNVPHFASIKGALSEEPSVLEEVLRSDYGQIVELKKASAWNRLVNGTKTAKGFAFGKKQTPVEFKIGDNLTFVHESETRSAEVTKVHQFNSLTDLASATELHGKLFDTAVPLNEAELAKLYSEYNPNYPEYIAETGLVVCEFELQSVKYKGNGGWIPLPASELPLELPKVEKYLPTDTGESPIAAMTDWVKTTCPKCGGPARRETDTMPNWAGSSWYFLRYTDPKNDKELASQENLKYWTPVDWYNGGMEHTVLHLLYSRFWNQFLYDIGVVPTLEPYKKRTSHGMILAKGGEKMSKSKGNVVNPDEMVEQYGADALRTYIMFMGPFDQAVEWDTNGLVGMRRFLEKVARLSENVGEHEPRKIWLMHKTIGEVTARIEKMSFNTAISALMVYANALENHLNEDNGKVSRQDIETLVLLLSPFAPHIAEEVWQQLGHNQSVAYAPWPKYNPDLAVQDQITVAVQVNGKVRAELVVSPEIAEEEIKALALANENIQKWLDGNEPKKVIYVKGRLVSIVV